MSEYQYYEFQAIDQALSKMDQDALRALSSRAQITSTRLVNTYNYGGFRGDPVKLMERWFDLHIYFANWGSRRLMMKLPKRFVDPLVVAPFISELDEVELRASGVNLILDVNMGECEADYSEDGSGVLAALAPLRADVLRGDLRLFYLVWLIAVQFDLLDDETPEPLPGAGPLTGSLEAFASFVDIDPDLVEAAAERAFRPKADSLSSKLVAGAIARLPAKEKDALLVKVFHDDPHAATELRRAVEILIADDVPASSPTPRTAGELRARAKAIRDERAQAAARKAAAERERQAEMERKARRVRMDAIIRRGESVWTEIENEIERRNADGYDRAAGLLHDLYAIAAEKGKTEEFSRRIAGVRERHAKKGRFINRLKGIE